MSIVKCSNGHYFDDEKNASCPYCEELGFLGNGGSPGFDPDMDEATSAFMEDVAEPVDYAMDEMTAGYSDFEGYGEDERTMGFFETRLDMDPVVGWLVCVSGNERGRDYRLHAGRNFIGRSEDMEVTIYDDLSVSRDSHCSVIYDPLHGDFLLAPGVGTIVHYKGKPLKDTALLEDGDEFGIGESSFVFVAFCKGERKWL